MKLLFITQIIDAQHDDLAFTIQWVDAFIQQGYDVQVVCLEKGTFDGHFPVFSLGKEVGNGKYKSILLFIQYILTHKFDRVFVHMNPEYFTLGGLWWFLNRTPMYLWYTHYTTHFHLKLAGLLCKRMFAATKQSLPQYEGSPKKIITGHGVDVTFWQNEGAVENKNIYELLMVHRLSRSKRVEKGIQALALLPINYTLTIYGRAVDPLYYEELKQLVLKLGLTDRVAFKGPVPMPELRNIYPHYSIMINMASETIDKTMLEAMLNGIFPLTTPGNSEAIGLPVNPQDESPQALADFILNESQQINYSKLSTIVNERHGLKSLVEKLDKYIMPGV